MSPNNESGSPFTSISPSEFFYRNRQMAGFGNPSQAVYSTLRELVENSLDACEDGLCLPKVKVRISTDESSILTITISDNGIGVPYSEVPRAFGRVLYGSKYGRRQRRGTFGLGVTMAVLYGQITTDSPVIVHTQVDDNPGHRFQLLIDIEKNEPIVEKEETVIRNSIGTSVTIRLRGDLKRVQDRIIEYLQLTSAGTPYARIEYQFDDESAVILGPWSSNLPRPTHSCKPHPRAVDMELLRRLISDSKETNLRSFLVTSFQQLGVKTAAKFLSFLGLDPQTPIDTLSRRDLSRISLAMRRYDGFGRPESTCLSPIGEKSFIQGVRSIFNTSYLKFAHHGVFEWEGNPVHLEGVLAIGDEFPSAEVPTLYRFANRVPLLYDASEDVLTKVLRKVDWSRYGVSKPQPIAIFVNVSSTRIPYKAAGKQSIAHVTEIETGALSLLRLLGRSLGRAITAIGAASRDTRKRREYSEMIRIVAKYSSALANHENIPSTTPIIEKLFEVNSDDNE
ncbi:MAG: DNA topoisomerase VI subunit B [Promethearchaeota archaeon]